MFKYMMKRTAYMFVSLFIITSVTFMLIHSIPGNPIEAMCERLPESTRQHMFEMYGFDKPLSEQYKDFWENLIVERDLGESLKHRGRKVTDTIKRYAPVSGLLGVQAILIGLIFGIMLGVVAALNRGRRLDYLVMLLAILGVSIPNFIVASLLQYFLAFKLGWLPSTGWEGFSYTILPSIALSFSLIAEYSRYMRANCLDVLNQDYIMAAKAKGLSRFQIIRKHVIRNAILPIITLIGPQLARMFGGVFVVETIFSIPGLGAYFVESVANRDYTMIMGQTIFLSTLYILSTMIVDILYCVVDPRIKLDRAGER
ncbi:MAG: ABC transporter permease [Peptacetobacter hiranonis]|nr:ABC transporter permease [Peptacetobacter hiranonis]